MSRLSVKEFVRMEFESEVERVAKIASAIREVSEDERGLIDSRWPPGTRNQEYCSPSCLFACRYSKVKDRKLSQRKTTPERKSISEQ